MIDVDKLPIGGICIDCLSKDDCPMKYMLPPHRAYAKAYGSYYKESRPDLWEEASIDEPEYSDDTMLWCPQWSEK